MLTPMDARTSSSISGRHILVVEDEALIAFALLDDLEALGAVPHGPCPSVSSALTLISSGARLDGALLNVRLRGELSFPIAGELRRRGIPFVFVTGNDATVTARYPDVPVHPKPADLGKVVDSLGGLFLDRTGEVS